MAVAVTIPSVGESISEVTISEWTKNDGDYVNKGDVVMVLETDKASVEVSAEESGTLKITTQAGETIAVGAEVAKIEPGAPPAGASAPKKEEAPAVAAAKPATNGSKSNGNGAAASLSSEKLSDLAPAVRGLVMEHGVDPDKIPGTGRGGRLTKEDVMNYVGGAGATAKPASSAPSTGAGAVKAPTIDVDRQEIKPMSAIRKTIARRLKEVQNTAAILTTFNEVDLTHAMDLRKKYQDDFVKKHGVKLGLMSIFIKACTDALQEFPMVNAFIEGENFILNNFYNVGVAVSTERGLMVPVIRDADRLSLAGIELAIKALAEKGRAGKISMEDLSGGTFSVTNGGVFGSMMSTPILNPPQSAILGMHNIVERPMVVDGEIKIRPMMYVALSYDHRIIDGKEAVSFLVRVKKGVEDPQRLLIQV
ncbi:MAG: 2-oxoglutarate dehydrogenase complex dihydrolipoyllysine-residue succinyltransferase [Bdellovibrionales bacterium]|nr:2-oxoglutarate dehydrogenase complex dihydrolipoyllysine-residue succinyltransferase [Bdellovibrionales bacterium]